LIVAGGLSPEDASCLFLLSVATGQSRKLTASTAIAIGGDGGPALSPDGRTLAFFRGTNGSALEIFTLALTADLQPAGEPRQITFDNRRSLWPAWTADGREIVYTAEAQGTRTLWRVPANGSAKPRSLAGVGDRGAWPAISPRGNRLVYSRPAIDDNIWRIDFSGAQPKPPRRVVASTLRDVEPRLSPDGSRIAFASDRTGHIEVWTADSDGSESVHQRGTPMVSRWPSHRVPLHCNRRSTGNFRHPLVRRPSPPSDREPCARHCASLVSRWQLDLLRI
jgi:Tol biopolymer transport system component